jgi:hypothetical protein
VCRQQGGSHDLYFQNKQEAGTHIYPLDATTTDANETGLINDLTRCARVHIAICALFTAGGEIPRHLFPKIHSRQILTFLTPVALKYQNFLE